MLYPICSFRNSKKVCFQGRIEHKDIVVSVRTKGQGSSKVTFMKSDDGAHWFPVMAESSPTQVQLGTGNASKTDFLFQAGKGIEPGTLVIPLGEHGTGFHDDGAGKVLFRWNGEEREAGTIDYCTGDIDIRVEKGLLKKSDELMAQFTTGRNWVYLENGGHDLTILYDLTCNYLMVTVEAEGGIQTETYLYSNCNIGVLGKAMLV